MTSTYFSLQEVNAMNNLFRATGAGRVGSKMSSIRDGAAVERAVAEVDEAATVEIVESLRSKPSCTQMMADGSGSSRAGNQAAHVATTIMVVGGPILESNELPHKLTGHSPKLEVLSFEKGMRNILYKHRIMTLTLCVDGCKQLTTSVEREVLRAGTGKSGCSTVPDLRDLSARKIIDGTLKLPEKFYEEKKHNVASAWGARTQTVTKETPLSDYYRQACGCEPPTISEQQRAAIDTHHEVLRTLQARLESLDKNTYAECMRGKGNGVALQLREAWLKFRGVGQESNPAVGQDLGAEFKKYDSTKLYRLALGALNKVPAGKLRQLLKEAIRSNPRSKADNFTKTADWWHAQKTETAAWLKHLYQKYPISGAGAQSRNKMIREEAQNILLKHAKPHLRRCSQRGREVWEANSSAVHEHVMAISNNQSAYWQTIYNAATAISVWMRWRCTGLFFGGKYYGNAERPLVKETRNGKSYQVHFRGFNQRAFCERNGIMCILSCGERREQNPIMQQLIRHHLKSIDDLKLRRLHELGKLRRLCDFRRDAAAQAVRKCWQVEFHKHIGKPGTAPDHSMCSASACCRDPALAQKYKWYPVVVSLTETMHAVEDCMNLPSTTALLDNLASGDATCDVESFHALRCQFATKHTHFERWAMRNTMAKLHWNENCDRPTMYTYLSKQRRLGKTIEKKQLELPTWEWQKKVIDKAMNDSA